MQKGRLEAFSDGVLAIIITIMVLELHVPHEPTLAALVTVWPTLISYVLSFIYIGIYWNNHHHLLQASRHVSGRVLWANLHLLFWLSLIPFVTSWMGEHHFSAIPVAAYGVVLLMAGLAYSLLERSLIHVHGPESLLARAVGDDRKGTLSVVSYLAAVGLAMAGQAVWAELIYAAIACVWLVPDRRIEQQIHAEHSSDD
jgi:uncharacterized membrane protein